jgi:hypothetical protein
VNGIDPFKAPMTEFQTSITQRMLRLSEAYHQTLQACDQTAHYFGEDTGLVWEHMFRIFTTFLTSYGDVSKTIEAERIAKETKYDTTSCPPHCHCPIASCVIIEHVMMSSKVH